MAHHKRDVCGLGVEKIRRLCLACPCVWSSNVDEGSDWRKAGSRDLYLNLSDALDSAWDLWELDKYYLMIASFELADELNFETSSLLLSLLISRTETQVQALQTQMSTGQAGCVNE